MTRSSALFLHYMSLILEHHCPTLSKEENRYIIRILTDLPYDGVPLIDTDELRELTAGIPFTPFYEKLVSHNRGNQLESLIKPYNNLITYMYKERKIGEFYKYTMDIQGTQEDHISFFHLCFDRLYPYSFKRIFSLKKHIDNSR